jgi:hypothetical protein
VKVITLLDVPPRGDVSDYLEQHDREAFVALVRAAPPWTAATVASTDESTDALILTGLDVLRQHPSQDR